MVVAAAVVAVGLVVVFSIEIKVMASDTGSMTFGAEELEMAVMASVLWIFVSLVALGLGFCTKNNQTSNLAVIDHFDLSHQ